MKRRTTIPAYCPECGVSIQLPITRSLIVGNTASLYVDRGPLDAHLVVCEAERILEGA